MTTFDARFQAALAAAGDGPISLDADPLHMALLSCDREAMRRLVNEDADPNAETLRLQRLAEQGFVANKVNGQDVDLYLVAWPFLLNFGETGGRVPTKFDMGGPADPTGLRVQQLWHDMLDDDSAVSVIPMRLGLHAHRTYCFAPDVVQSFVQMVANAVSDGAPFVPRGLNLADGDEPLDAIGPIYAPVLLQAAVLVPRGQSVRFRRSAAAFDTARQLIASKLGLTTVTPSVIPLMPDLFYQALESTLQAENISMVLWEGGDSIGSEVQMHWDGEGSRVLSRGIELTFVSGRGRVAQAQAFDLQWHSPASVRASIDEMRRATADAETRRFYLQRAGAWSDPYGLN